MAECCGAQTGCGRHSCEVWRWVAWHKRRWGMYFPSLKGQSPLAQGPLNFISAQGRMICFRFFSSVHLSVCLSLCLSVNSPSQKVLHGFSWNFHQAFLITKGRASLILGDPTKKLLPWQPFFVIFQGKTLKSLYLHFYLTQKCDTWTIGKLFVCSTKVSQHDCHGNLKLMPWQPLLVFFKVKLSIDFISASIRLRNVVLDHWKAISELYQS